MSDHQPIFVVHKKSRDKRKTVTFEGRSYRNFNREEFKEELRLGNWNGYYELSDPGKAWEFILDRIVPILDKICPMRTFHVKNYRPECVTNELLEQIKDRDYFYCKAKRSGDQDSWNIAKYLRNVTNANIRSAKREFILEELEANKDNCKRFWKVIREVIPSNNQSPKQDILLKDGGKKIEKIDIGNPDGLEEHVGGPVTNRDTSRHLLDERENQGDPCKFDKLREVNVHRVVKEVNTSKSSGARREEKDGIRPATTPQRQKNGSTKRFGSPKPLKPIS